jgi:hypothetical protein
MHRRWGGQVVSATTGWKHSPSCHFLLETLDAAHLGTVTQQKIVVLHTEDQWLQSPCSGTRSPRAHKVRFVLLTAACLPVCLQANVPAAVLSAQGDPLEALKEVCLGGGEKGNVCMLCAVGIHKG